MILNSSHTFINQSTSLPPFTHIELVHGYHGDGSRVVAQLPHEGKVSHIPQYAGLVL